MSFSASLPASCTPSSLIAHPQGCLSMRVAHSKSVQPACDFSAFNSNECTGAQSLEQVPHLSTDSMQPPGSHSSVRVTK